MELVVEGYKTGIINHNIQFYALVARKFPDREDFQRALKFWIAQIPIERKLSMRFAEGWKDKRGWRLSRDLDHRTYTLEK